jgi:hypothetical protein
MSTVITQILTSLRQGSEAGRVKTDERGNNVWDWNLRDGDDGLSIEETSVLLSRLNNDKLSLVDDICNKEPKLDLEEPDAGGGFNPYGNGAARPRKNPFGR